MGAKDGKSAILKIGSTQFTGLLSQDFQYQVDTIDVTSKDSSGHKNFIAGEDGGTMSLSSVYDPSGTYSLGEIFAAASGKTLVALYFGSVTSTEEYISASGIITSVKWGAPKNDKQTVDVDFQLSGLIEFKTV